MGIAPDGGPTNQFLLPAGGRPSNPGELVTSEEFRNLIEALREKFDYVLIECDLPFYDNALLRVVPIHRSAQQVMPHAEDSLVRCK